MSPDEIDRNRACLEDMIAAIDSVADFIRGYDLARFEADAKTIQAVRACFITIGEAANRLPESFRGLHGEVPWGDVRQFRNFMVHVYDCIRADPLWDTATLSLPPLRKQIIKMLKALPPSE